MKSAVNPSRDMLRADALSLHGLNEEVEVVIDTANRTVTVTAGPVELLVLTGLDNLVVRRSDGVLLGRIKNGNTLFGTFLPGNTYPRQEGSHE